MFPGPYTYRCPVCRITVPGLTRNEARRTRDGHREQIHGSPLAKPDGERITRAAGFDQWRVPVIALCVFFALMVLSQFL